MINQHCEAYQNVDEECARLEDDLEGLGREDNEAKQQCHAKLQAKDRQLAKLQDILTFYHNVII
jgi:hypothetical protein